LRDIIDEWLDWRRRPPLSAGTALTQSSSCRFPSSSLSTYRERSPFDDDEWASELKFDGFRALAFIDKGECQLVSGADHV
jgi:ATP-dependent DNA ligase